MSELLDAFIKENGIVEDWDGDREAYYSCLGSFSQGWDEHTKTIKYGCLCQDDSSHWYLVPGELSKDFLRIMDEIEQLDEDSEEFYNAIDELEEKYGQYRLGGGPESLKVLMGDEWHD